MNYLSQTFLYPTQFETLLYASQLLQAEAMKYGVEHWRRNRGRCMGAVYWQLNDIWPVASWSSIDYFGRYKALHYYARRFFAPVMISCHETGETTDRISVVTEPSKIETSACLCISNEQRKNVSGIVNWALRDASANIITCKSVSVEVEALSSKWIDKIIFEECDFVNHYLSYEFCVGEECVSEGTVLFTAPKHFSFIEPNLRYVIEDSCITITADAYAKSVEIYCTDQDIVLSDNYFDMNAGSKRVQILKGSPEKLALACVYHIR